MSPPSPAPAPGPPTSSRTIAARWRANASSIRWTARRATRSTLLPRLAIAFGAGEHHGDVVAPDHAERVEIVDCEGAHRFFDLVVEILHFLPHVGLGQPAVPISIGLGVE